MSLFYSAYFIKTQEPKSRLKQKFSRVDILPNSEWIVCDYGDDYFDDLFEPGVYFTLEISSLFGETIFICMDTSNDQLDYEHSKSGNILRKLSWHSDGCQSLWTWVEGDREEWEESIVFSEENFLKTKEIVEYDLDKELLAQKEEELRTIWFNRQYILEDKCPLGDATLGFAIQDFFGIKLPDS